MSTDLRKEVFELRRNLSREANQQGIFLKTLEDHRQAILSFDAERIERSRAALAEATDKAMELRRERRVVLQRISRLMGVPAEELHLSQIAQASGDSALGELKATLGDVTSQVEQRARSVLMLNRSHTDAYSKAIRILIGDDPIEAQERRRNGGVLVNREA